MVGHSRREMEKIEKPHHRLSVRFLLTDLCLLTRLFICCTHTHAEREIEREKKGEEEIEV